MIDIDNPPLVISFVILVVFTLPFLLSFVIDNYDKGKPQIKS